MSNGELHTRTCRACGRPYEYPVCKSLATRAHCENCAMLDPAIRRTFEQFQRRLKGMEHEVNTLKSGGGTDKETQP